MVNKKFLERSIKMCTVHVSYNIISTYIFLPEMLIDHNSENLTNSKQNNYMQILQNLLSTAINLTFIQYSFKEMNDIKLMT